MARASSSSTISSPPAAPPALCANSSRTPAASWPASPSLSSSPTWAVANASPRTRSSRSSPTMTQSSNLPEPIEETYLAPQPAYPADRLISTYLRTLTSPQTIKTYNTELRMFVSYLEGEIGKGLEQLTAEDISLYRQHLIKTYSAATAAKKLAVLRRVFVFSQKAGATPPDTPAPR